jgi:hypothetical protein
VSEPKLPPIGVEVLGEYDPNGTVERVKRCRSGQWMYRLGRNWLRYIRQPDRWAPMPEWTEPLLPDPDPPLPHRQ